MCLWEYANMYICKHAYIYMYMYMCKCTSCQSYTAECVREEGEEETYRWRVVSVKSVVRSLSAARADLNLSLRRPNTNEPHLVERVPNEHT